VPSEENPLLEMLMNRKANGESPEKKRRSSGGRPRKSAAAATAEARRKSKGRTREIEEALSGAL
jgi:hypothetical protein